LFSDVIHLFVIIPIPSILAIFAAGLTDFMCGILRGIQHPSNIVEPGHIKNLVFYAKVVINNLRALSTDRDCMPHRIKNIAQNLQRERVRRTGTGRLVISIRLIGRLGSSVTTFHGAGSAKRERC
jgi:hypothetical protein